ncbi:MAG: rRNA maturation RNase YbeY [Candidatus Pacebacteria bacterium]|nr:rRNA maturation RNase YbeY [Candidatus Paceibacterota bacterium]PIR63893.1 MAG: rRNA maturation RNase YbeY [Candidatus Pacebacteria bacterium CG10_big_fil_rev_8_21_14_0_10_40_26]PIZ78330.1 MAG: rRNA maturation RNase YbeY [Candidatus Pacebacteria bacterium CG_4_10_14_0_2_um_filter_40_20]PJA68626.1 MAG: rRNA maturation RNase YbeY [Candidatus Pacebacteria bacterium CG_4_9_14_3_um_filter_40_12]PJC41566.1 MAG: rRNA maturation RNase YbeY [Candidatus Pacebacteria bacterium CG_4_9_14_0_2_um_filter_4
MIQINLYIGSRYPVNRAKLRAAAKAVLANNGISHAQVDISVVGKRKIKALNESKLKHEGTTDVLSFPIHEKHKLDDFPLPEGIPPHLGDIMISFPEAVNTAKKYGKMVDDQICFYLQHGMMHLLGYHHD